MEKKYNYYKNSNRNKKKSKYYNNYETKNSNIKNNNNIDINNDDEEEEEEEQENIDNNENNNNDDDEKEIKIKSNNNYKKNKKNWNDIKAKNNNNSTEIIGECPECKKGNIIITERAYSCNRWREGCKFAIWKNNFEKLNGKPITKKMAISLLNGEKVNLGKMVSIRTGKEFEPLGILQKDEEYGWKIQFIFE